MVNPDDFPDSEADDENAALTRIYTAQYDAMMDNYYDEGGNDYEAQRIAEHLLSKANLPVFFQAQAHLVLATFLDNPAVHHAEEAIRILDTDLRDLCTEAEFPKGLLDDARRMLRDIKERYSQRVDARLAQEQAEVDSSPIRRPPSTPVVPGGRRRSSRLAASHPGSSPTPKASKTPSGAESSAAAKGSKEKDEPKEKGKGRKR